MSSQQQILIGGAATAASSSTATTTATIASSSTANSTQPSFDEVSKYFHLPFSDAASALGVCTSVLKKICHDNGLDRWPYRQILSGKSVEDIKKYAAGQRNKRIIVLSKAGKESGIQQQKKEVPKSQNTAAHYGLQEEGSKNVQLVRSPNWLKTGLKATTILDEFKYGYPSNGLSVASYKWWGSCSSDDSGRVCGNGLDFKDKEQMEETTDNNARLENIDREKPENENLDSNASSQGTGLLKAVRKRIVEEGRQALKVGVYRRYGVNKVGKKERRLLSQIFGASLPKWVHGSC